MTFDRIVTFDIETVWTRDQRIIDSIRENLAPPATHKKQETIDKWWAEESPKVLEDRLAKTAVDGMRGEVTAIGWVEHRLFADGSTAQLGPAELYVRAESDPYRDWLGKRLDQLNDMLGANRDREEANVTLAGHNIASFDLPFLWQQAVRFDLPWGRALPRGPYWDGDMIDTMVALVGRRDTISLENACAACGIEYDATQIPSKDIPQAWLDGNLTGVADHLENDVLSSAQLALRVGRITRVGREDLDPGF